MSNCTRLRLWVAVGLGLIVLCASCGSDSYAGTRGDSRDDPPELRAVGRLEVEPGTTSAFAFASFELNDGPFELEDTGRSVASRRLVEVMPDGRRHAIDLGGVLPDGTWSSLIDADSAGTTATLLFAVCHQAAGPVVTGCLSEQSHLFVVVEAQRVVSATPVAFPQPEGFDPTDAVSVGQPPVDIAVDEGGDVAFVASRPDAAGVVVLWSVSLADGSVKEVPGSRIDLGAASPEVAKGGLVFALSCAARDGSLSVAWTDMSVEHRINVDVTRNGSRSTTHSEIAPVVDLVCGPSSALVVGRGGQSMLVDSTGRRDGLVPAFGNAGSLDELIVALAPSAEPVESVIVAYPVTTDQLGPASKPVWPSTARGLVVSEGRWGPPPDGLAVDDPHAVVVDGTPISFAERINGAQAL